MNKEDTFTLLASVIAEQFNVPVGSIDAETVALDVAGWDSFSNGMLFMRLEECVGRPLPFDELANASNVGEMADVLTRSA